MASDVCLGLRLYVPFWCSFRDPLTSNVHRTFPVPPPSTLYGLVAAALGLPQDDQSYRTAIRFAVAIDQSGDLVETYSKWMKAAEDPLSKATPANKPKIEAALQAMRNRGELTPDLAVWISTPIIRQKIIQPIFTIGILCQQEIAQEIADAIRHPAFPLYLGESDDVVDVEQLGLQMPEPTTAPATGAVSGVREGGTLASLPCRFVSAARGRWEMTRWLVTVPRPGAPLASNLPDSVSCHGHVWSFEPPVVTTTLDL